MSSIYGKLLQMSVFGESHNPKMGVTINGLPAGIELDLEFIKSELKRRRPSKKENTARVEQDQFEIICGYFLGKTTGAPLTIIIENSNVRSGDYSDMQTLMRPGHADYPAYVKYHGANDYRGGGHFSGRLTAVIVAAGAIAKQLLRTKNISLQSEVLVDEKKLAKVIKQGDSLGGKVQTIISNVEAGVGEPMFESVESRLSAGIFSIPGVKALSFGIGEAFKDKKGSEVVDELVYENNQVKTLLNNNGGINGGITNGMDIIVNTTFKPAASIAQTVKTIDVSKQENSELTVKGRHDSFYVDRATVVVEAIAAFTILDLIFESEGKSWTN